MPEGMCDRAMDLAFLLDGSEALSEEEFQATKEFILGVVERFRMGSAHTRATVLLYHSGVKTYDLQVDKHKVNISDTVKCLFKTFSQCLSVWSLYSIKFLREKIRATKHYQTTSGYLTSFSYMPVGSEVAV